MSYKRKHKSLARYYRDKISALLMDTDEQHHISVHIPLELGENQGLSTNDMLTVEEIWQNPTEGIIMLKIRGIEEPEELEVYEECLEQIYRYLWKTRIF